MNTIQEREDTIVRNILSGKNACGALLAAVTNRDGEYFRCAVRSVLQAYEEESQYAREQRDTLLRESEIRRQALEYVVANVTLPGAIAEVVGKALGRVIA